MTEEARKRAEILRNVEFDECIEFPYAVHTMLQTDADLIESLSAQLDQVTRERDAAISDIDEAAPCFACIHFERNGGDCIGAHVCIDDVLQDALGGKYSDYYWQWRGVEVEG